MTTKRHIVLALVGVVAIYAAWQVWDRSWTCDDAFISYRYARNLVEGRGLVFNPGERVEGHTSFLHTIGLAGAMAAGAEPRFTSMLFGAVSYFAVAAVLAWWSFRRGRTIPIAAVLWLAQDDLHTWATGGLETTMFAAFAVSGIALVVVRKRYIAAGLLLAAACLTRPDGVLFALVGLGAVALEKNRRALASIAAPLAAIGGAFVAFKLAYYGHLLPTAFHAKSANEAQYERGLVYIALYFAKHRSTTFAVVAFPLALVVMKRVSRIRGERDALVALAAFVLFTAYVAHSGGDSMFARRLVPALPFLFVFLEATLHVLPERLLLPASGLVLCGALVPARVLPERVGGGVAGVADERVLYPEAAIAGRKRQGLLAHDVFRDIPMKAAFGGGMCTFAYYSELPYLVEPNGLVGHHGVSREALREHGVVLAFHNDAPSAIALEPRFDEVIIDGALRAEILFYDDAVMEALARDPRVRMKRVEDVLREAEADIRTMSCGDAGATLAALDEYWLSAHAEPRARFRRLAEERCAPR